MAEVKDLEEASMVCCAITHSLIYLTCFVLAVKKSFFDLS